MPVPLHGTHQKLLSRRSRPHDHYKRSVRHRIRSLFVVVYSFVCPTKPLGLNDNEIDSNSLPQSTVFRGAGWPRSTLNSLQEHSPAPQTAPAPSLLQPHTHTVTHLPLYIPTAKTWKRSNLLLPSGSRPASGICSLGYVAADCLQQPAPCLPLNV